SEDGLLDLTVVAAGSTNGRFASIDRASGSEDGLLDSTVVATGSTDGRFASIDRASGSEDGLLDSTVVATGSTDGRFASIDRATGSDDRDRLAEFRDRHDIAPWSRAAVNKAVNLGLMQGLPDGRFAPRRETSRAEAASVIYRLVGLTNGQ